MNERDDDAQPTAGLDVLAAQESARHAEAIARYAHAARNDNTVRAYETGWRLWAAFCAEQRALGLDAPELPANPAMVAAWATVLGDAHKSRSTIGVRIAAIAWHHTRAGYPSPTDDARVRAVLRDVRKVSRESAGKEPLLLESLRALLAAAPAGLHGTRDRALLLLGFYGALRRSELCALRVEHVREVDQGVELLLPRSKTDQSRRGRTVAVPYLSTPELCPVRALRAWLRAAGLTTGPVFRAIDPAGVVATDALGAREVARCVKRYARAANLAGVPKLAAHSLRSGFATEAARRGKHLRKIQEQLGHASPAMSLRYVRDRERWDEHAAYGLE